MKKAYKHDFDGAWSPGEMTPHCETFSVGIFQWIPKVNGKGLKKSAVKFRVRGKTSEPEKVYKHARRICDMLDNGEELYAKSCTV